MAKGVRGRGLLGVGMRRDVGIVRQGGTPAYVDALNEVVIAIMVEKKSCVDNLDAILSVPGIDMVQFGASDFSMSIGKTGQYSHPDVLAAETKTIQTALKKGLHPRVELRDPEPGRPLPRNGRQAFLHRLGRPHPRRLVGHQGRARCASCCAPSRRRRRPSPRRPSKGAARRRQATARARQLRLSVRSRSRPSRPASVPAHAPWRHARGRLCLAEGRQLAGGAARPGACSIPTSGPIWRPRTATPRRSSGRRRRCRRRWSPRCAGASRRTMSGVPSPTGPFAYLWKYREGGQHELIGRTPRDGGERPRSCSTATHWPRRRTTSSSAARAIRRTTASKPGAPTCAARSISPSGCATGRPARTCPTRRADQRRRRVGRRFDVLPLCPQDENHRPLKVYRHRLGTAQADDVLVYEEKDSGWFTRVEESSSGRFAIVATGDQETSERWLIDLVARQTPRRAWSRRARPACATASSIAATSCSSSPTTAMRSTSASPRRRSRRRTAPLAAADPAPARHLHHRHGALRRPSGAAGARERPALDRDPRPADGAEHAIAFDEAAYALDIVDGYEFDTTTPRFVYRRRPRRPRSTTTTWRAASAPCARARRSPPATIRPPT